jgi:hypothetical protein
MKSKLIFAILILVVAVGAYVAGRWQQSPAEEAEQVMEPPPAPPPPLAASEVASPPPAPTPPAQRAAPAQAVQPSTPAAAPVSEPSAPVAAEPEPLPPPPPPEPVKVRLAEGTKIAFSLNNALSTKTSRTGDPFSGVVSRPVQVGDTVAIPQGAVIRGTVGQVERPGRVSGRAYLGLRIDQLELPDGQVYDLSASLSELDQTQKEEVTEEGQVKGESSKKRDAVTIGAGAGIGAAVGAIAGGGKGAGTGAAVGAGAGTAMVLLTRGKDVELARGTELAIQLNQPLAVTIK